MFSADDLDRINRAAQQRPSDPTSYHEKLCEIGQSYALALMRSAPPPPSQIARKLQSLERGRSKPIDDDVRRLLTIQARRAGYEGNVGDAALPLLAEWAGRVRRRLETRVAHRKAHGQPPHRGDEIVNAFIQDIFAIYLEHFARDKYPRIGELSPAAQFIQATAHVLSKRMGGNDRLDAINFDRIRRQIPTAKTWFD